MSFDFFDEEPRELRIHNNERNITADLLKLFAFVYYNKIPLLKNNKIRKNNYTKILKNFVLVKDAPYLDFLLDFATARHLLVKRGSFWEVDLPAVMAFFERPEEAFGEIYRFMEERLRQDRKGRIVLETLRRLPAGRWVNFERFYRHLVGLSKSFIDPPAFFKNKYYANKHVASNKQLTENLFAMELFWCGVVRVAFRKPQNLLAQGAGKQELIDAITAIVHNNNLNPEQLVHLPDQETERLRELYEDLYRLTKLDFDLESFCITPLGKALLERRRTTRFFGRKTSKFTVQPNFEVVVPPQFDERKFFTLLSFIETVRTETLNTFRITRSSVLNAALEGMSEKDLLGFLRANSAVKVPPNVVELVRECYAQFRRMGSAEECCVLKGPKALVRKLTEDRSVARWIAERPNAETLVLKRNADVRKIVAKYRGEGLRVEFRR